MCAVIRQCFPAGVIPTRQTLQPKPKQRPLETLCDRMSGVLDKLMPFERPRLAAVTVKGDADNPLRVKADLSALSDEKLNQLERICLKAGARKPSVAADGSH
jgi:hypothetical protein